MEQRKADHISMALQSQMKPEDQDARFHYEPLLHPHPGHLPVIKFLGKEMKAPLWISSMTGGTNEARKINENLARACRDFGLGMGLGSCRVLLEGDTYLADFALRDIIGDDQPFYANLGISQVEQLVYVNNTARIHEMVSKLRADGLIIHVNPLQEWFQPEGDRLQYAPIETIKRFLDLARYPVIVKEVGQGMGPASLGELLRLPLAAVEFASFGGTNFARAELLRQDKKDQQVYEPFTRIGENASDMVDYANAIFLSDEEVMCRQVIISGGIRNFLDGYYLLKKIHVPAVYGQASGFLRHARESYSELHDHVEAQVNGLKLAFQYLTIKA